jgi:hypothetical protein
VKQVQVIQNDDDGVDESSNGFIPIAHDATGSSVTTTDAVLIQKLVDAVCFDWL